jgi:hypothetical protein
LAYCSYVLLTVACASGVTPCLHIADLTNLEDALQGFVPL